MNMMKVKRYDSGEFENVWACIPSPKGVGGDTGQSGVGLGGLTALNVRQWRNEALRLFENALDTPMSDGIVTLHGDLLDDKGLAGVVDALASTKLEALILSHNTIGDTGTTALAKALMNNTHTTALHLGDNNIGAAGASMLAKVLATHTNRLTTLDLGGNDIGRAGVAAIARALARSTCKLRELSLQNTCLGDGDGGQDSFQKLCLSLQKNRVLQVLDLSMNSSTVLESSLARLLTTNTTLTDLDLSGISCCSESLAAAVAVNTTLTVLKLNGSVHYPHTDLFEALALNSTIKTLFLRGNVLNEDAESEEHVADLISRNTTLLDLDLQANGFNDVSAAKFKRASSTLLRLKFGDDDTSSHFQRALKVRNLQRSQGGLPQRPNTMLERINSRGLSLSIIHGISTNDPVLQALRLSHTNVDSASIVVLACALQSNNTLQEIWLNDIGLRDEDVGFLAQHPGVTRLNVSNNRIGPQGAEDIGRALALNTKIRGLWIGGNRIGAEGAGKLIDALSSNTTFTTLDLIANQIFDAHIHKHHVHGLKLMYGALARNTTLCALRLVDNNIHDNDALELARALERNTTLTTLDLSCNSFGDEGTMHLARLLRQGSLTALGLRDNRISLRGLDELFRSVRENTTCSVLDVSYQNQELQHDDAQGFHDVARGLSLNSTLRRLCLAGIQMSDDAIKRLGGALAVNSTLRELDLSATYVSDIGATELAQCLCRNSALATLLLDGSGRSDIAIGDAGADKMASMVC